MRGYSRNIIYLLPLLKLTHEEIGLVEIDDCKLVGNNIVIDYDAEQIWFRLPNNINRMLSQRNTNPEEYNVYTSKLILNFWSQVDPEITSYLKKKYHESRNRKYIK